MPELWKSLEKMGFFCDFLFGDSFLSIFCNYFESENLYCIWDYILIENTKK